MGVGIDFYHYFGNESIRFSIDKLDEDETLYIGECISKFRDFLEAVVGYEVDEETIKKYWERM